GAKGYRLTVGLICASASDASQIASSLKEVWYGKKVQDQLGEVERGLDLFGQTELKPIVSQIKTEMEFSSDAATATVSIDLSQQLIDDVIKAAMKWKGMGGPAFRNRR